MSTEKAASEGVVQSIAESSGLLHTLYPHEPLFRVFGYKKHFKLVANRSRYDRVSNQFYSGGVASSTSHPDGYKSSRWCSINCNEYIIQAVKELSPAHILGKAVLVRFGHTLTAMTNIAEASRIIYGPDLAELTWIILRSIEISMRRPKAWLSSDELCFEWQEDRILTQSSFDSFTESSKAGTNDTSSRPVSEEKSGTHQAQHSTVQTTKDEKLEDTLVPKLEIRKSPEQDKHTVQKSSADAWQAVSTKYYSFIQASSWEDRWTIRVDTNIHQEITTLLDWLELSLGSLNFTRLNYTEVRTTRIENENEEFRSVVGSPLANCWRIKFEAGNIIGLGSLLPNVPENYHDGLALTAAALWSLFDHNLERRGRCTCTFYVPGDGYLQCCKKDNDWLIWHYRQGDQEEICTGEKCGQNVRISTSEEEPGVRIFATTPCLLGWKAESRDKPSSVLWDVLCLSREFKKRELATYQLNQIQVSTQLSVPLPVAPQIGGAATFSKTHYTIRNSIDRDSILAMEIAAVATVLVYDEVRKVHLLCDGADIIELICMSFLRELHLDDSCLPEFSHPTALGRLLTWYHSSFTTLTGRLISGAVLVRQATNTVSDLHGVVKTTCSLGAVPYFSLEQVLRGGELQAFRRPNSPVASWEALAKSHPPIILAVGSLEKSLVNANGGTITEPEAERFTFLRSIFGGQKSAGIISDLRHMEQWIAQAKSAKAMMLYATEATVHIEDKLNLTDYVLKVQCCPSQPDHIARAECSTCSSSAISKCVHLVR